MNQALFLDQNLRPSFEKIASPIKLSDTPENWQKEVASEIYKQLPFIADYAVNIMLDRIDPQRGYGFGSADVSNQTDAPTPDRPSAMLRIPIVVKDRLLQAFDVFIEGSTVYPLNERRVREKLFRTESFETSTRKPTDQGMVDQLYPPLRTNYGYGNAVSTGVSGGFGGMGKIASEDRDELRDLILNKQDRLMAAIRETGNFFAAKEKIAEEDRLARLGEFAHARGKRSKEKEQKKAKEQESAALAPQAPAAPQPPTGTPDAMATAVDGLMAKAAGRYDSAIRAAGQNVDNVARLVMQARANRKSGEGQHELYDEKDSCMKTAYLIEEIAPTIRDMDKEAMVRNIELDQELALLIARQPTLAKLATTILTSHAVPIEKTAAALVSSLAPTVVQLTKLAAGDFLVRWANVNAFAPQEIRASEKLASEMAGADLGQMQPGQSVTLSTETAQLADLSAPKVALVDEYGQYKVWDEQGQEHVGTVYPVVDFEMQLLPLHVWSDGQSFSVQDDIAGTRVGHEPPQPAAQAQPQGDGCFVFVAEDGRGMATVPLTVTPAAAGPDGGQQIHVSDSFGQEMVLTPQQGVTEFLPAGEGSFIVPALGPNFFWQPLQNPVHLVKEVDNVGAQQAQAQAPNQVQVKSTGQGEFSLGGAPVEKVASERRQFIKQAEAEFLLVAMGMDPFHVREQLGNAQKFGSIKVAGLREIVPLAHLHQQMIKKAQLLLEEFPWYLRRNLIKEAAALEDSETADKILSLNFINPENLSIFANNLPQLDETSCKLAEMLLAARLGMHQVNEGAAERAMKNLEEVIQGLRALQQKNMV